MLRSIGLAAALLALPGPGSSVGITPVGAGAASAQVARVGTGVGAGRIIPVSAFERGTNLAGRPVETVLRGTLRIGWRWDDPELRHPEYGVGVSGLGFRGTSELGSPTAVFGFVRLPVAGSADGPRLTFGAALGAALGWRAFDPVDNPRQISIGSEVSATFALGLGAEFPLSDRFDLVADADYHHWSNGNLRQPNIGLNAIVGGVGIAWRTDADRRGEANRGSDAARRGSGGSTAQGVGGAASTGRASAQAWRPWVQPFVAARGIAADNRHVEQDDVYERQLLPIAGVHVGMRRTVSRLWDVAFSVNATLDASGFRDHQVPGLREGPLDSDWAASFGASFSGLLRTGPAELEFGVGYSPIDLGGARGTSRFTQRLGVHLLPEGRIVPSIVLRALNFDRPNFIEWGVALR